MAHRFRMSAQWVKNERPRSCQHRLFISNREQGTDASAFTPFTCNLNSQLDKRLNHLGIVFGDLAKNAFKHKEILEIRLLRQKYLRVGYAKSLSGKDERGSDGDSKPIYLRSASEFAEIDA